MAESYRDLKGWDVGTSLGGMPTVPNYSLSNNITGNPACLQSNASSYSCMLPDMLEWYKEGLSRIKSDMEPNLEYDTKDTGNMLETSRAWQDYVSGTARSYDPLTLSNYSRSSCNPAAGMQSHMTSHSTNGASTGNWHSMAGGGFLYFM
ncbi:uncharacterized protein LOC106874021 isoform X2 [Octopus bimaculoides]|uniref:uncharacterized protein LOC106874021 isoform X2 n=1 Tax=Octopus bimaculoides TaxID=37653 RepID=UPI00071C907D|nr:uncharacterized protein LOC106874021 isoform X2 [Octopus bimaculoides]|eukprot:XP_014777068.1 PREDICTED: uncharacterized protein LOC106874021 isoform X2 [Octopus bimaculoides]